MLTERKFPRTVVRRYKPKELESSGDYCPENCRWATRVQQNRNTRRNRFIEYCGRRMCVSEAARSVGLTRNKVLWRLNHGWPVAKALGPNRALV